MAEQDAITQATGLSIQFGEPASPCQRATNENTNGLLRQCSPKGNDLSVHSPAGLRPVQRELNDRPRDSLNSETPADVFASLAAGVAAIRCVDRWKADIARGSIFSRR